VALTFLSQSLAVRLLLLLRELPSVLLMLPRRLPVPLMLLRVLQVLRPLPRRPVRRLLARLAVALHLERLALCKLSSLLLRLLLLRVLVLLLLVLLLLRPTLPLLFRMLVRLREELQEEKALRVAPVWAAFRDALRWCAMASNACWQHLQRSNGDLLSGGELLCF